MTEAAFGTILVPLDGSASAEHALAVAADIARRSGARLALATVHVPMAMLLAGGDELALDDELERELRRDEVDYIAAVRAGIAVLPAAAVSGAVLDIHRSVADTLSGHAHAVHAGLVVMTTHGHGGLKRFWLGSVADGVLRRLQVPLLLLKPADRAASAEFRSIVVALDGSPEAEQVLAPTVALGSLSGARYVLVQVVEPPVALLTRLATQPAHLRPHWRERQENSARAYLERVASRLRGGVSAVATQVLGGRNVGEQILDFAREVDADLIAVGTHGARGVERLLVGSVADKVIRGASQPVLVVPTRMGREAG